LDAQSRAAITVLRVVGMSHGICNVSTPKQWRCVCIRPLFVPLVLLALVACRELSVYCSVRGVYRLTLVHVRACAGWGESNRKGWSAS
jgi:hypothetical protein